jgi:hypothetical protein
MHRRIEQEFGPDITHSHKKATLHFPAVPNLTKIPRTIVLMAGLEPNLRYRVQ